VEHVFYEFRRSYRIKHHTGFLAYFADVTQYPMEMDRRTRFDLNEEVSDALRVLSSNRRFSVDRVSAALQVLLGPFFG
jgi:hypothetical protein